MATTRMLSQLDELIFVRLATRGLVRMDSDRSVNVGIALRNCRT
jgi:hypothetical protein